MLETIRAGFDRAKNALTGKTELTEQNIQQAVREIRRSLLEGDVALTVVESFIERVKQNALGKIVQLQWKEQSKKFKRTAGEHFLHICYQELLTLIGPEEETPIIFHKPLTTIMLVGLQGTGKTTTAAKLAHFIQTQPGHKKRRVLLVAADIYRPAAVQQLQTLGKQLDIEVFTLHDCLPVELCRKAQSYAQENKIDTVIFDTAGRLAIDDKLMQELVQIQSQSQPHYVYLVCDAMAGQDTVRTAKTFHEKLSLSGFILSKMDGDARGGAALSIKSVTGVPIKFIGTGEATYQLERFRPESLASRILGMGDLKGLVEDMERLVDIKETAHKKLAKGTLGFMDFVEQFKWIDKMGGAEALMSRLPQDVLAMKQAHQNSALDPQKIGKTIRAIADSMTPSEKEDPALLKNEKRRIERIARGCGRTAKDVEETIDRFLAMQSLFQNAKKNPGLLQKMLPSSMQRFLKTGTNTPPGFNIPAGEEKNAFGQGLWATPGASATSWGGPLAPTGYNAPTVRIVSSADKAKSKQKRKQERQARKKSRR